MNFYVLTAFFADGYERHLVDNGVPFHTVSVPRPNASPLDLLRGYLFVPVSFVLSPHLLPRGVRILLQNESPVTVSAAELDLVRAAYEATRLDGSPTPDFLADAVLDLLNAERMFPGFSVVLDRMATRRGGHWIA